VTLPEHAGLAAAANLKTLDLDQWWPVLNELRGKGGAGEVSVTGLGLRVDSLIVLGRRFNDVNMRAHLEKPGIWQASGTARELAGEMRWRSEGRGALDARLKYLVQPDRVMDSGKSDDPSREMPALAVIADRYTYEGHDLGRLELAALPEVSGWRLLKLELAAPEGTMSAKGLWQFPGSAGERATLELKAATQDVGKYLARFGYPDVVAKGTADLEGALAWTGPLARIDYPSLAGNLTFKAEAGQFLKLEPGMGKLLGVLSLQSLPRRLTLDFRDIFSEGFAFDSIAGSAKIAQGIATTEGLAMAGPSASIAIAGTTDLARETQDLTVRVVPVVGDSVAIAATLALLNPIIGAGAFLAQRLLKDPLGQMLAFEYHVTGTWEDPKVVKTRDPQLPAGEAPAAKPPEGAQEAR
jgi:uncharacterized protein YhdP